MSEYSRVCPWCQESFGPTHFNQKFCCRNHAQKASNERLRTKQNFKVCGCGETFRVTQQSRTYCSDACATKFSSQKKTVSFAKWVERNNEKYKLYGRKTHLKNRYGLTEEQYEAVLQSQNGLCAVCGKSPVGGRPLYVDHDHITNKIRGLCCHSCNCAIGLFKNDPQVIANAYWYIVSARGGEK